jgi:hypothetical protein
VAFTKQPIVAGACPTCIWGPLAAWTRDAVKPYGYTVRVCWNCNPQLSVPTVPTVARAMDTPPLLPEDVALGDPAPPRGKVDFGVTNSHTLWRAYVGDGYQDGPQKHTSIAPSTMIRAPCGRVWVMFHYIRAPSATTAKLAIWRERHVRDS